jgi:carbohydrate esterase-like sialic acid-specific acetylesterase
LKLSKLMTAIAIGIAVGAVLFGTYWFGAYSYASKLWPANHFTGLQLTLLQSWRPPGVDYGPYARLIAYPGKTTIACPPQTDRSAVLLILGQSNAANTGGQRFRSQSGHVINYFDGKCTIAASPLLGTSGIAGEPWSAIGDGLVNDKSFDDVVLAPIAVGGSALSQWVSGGDLHSMLKEVVDDAQRHYRITHVLWHQGEGDFSLRTTEEQYVSGFQSLARDLHNWGVAAPIYVSVATRCEQLDTDWSAGNPVSRAQRKLGKLGEGFAAGIDTDALLNAVDRFDGCHMGGSGLAKVIEAWTAILRTKAKGSE